MLTIKSLSALLALLTSAGLLIRPAAAQTNLCPTTQPETNSICDWPQGLKCNYGEETAVGLEGAKCTFPELVLHCGGGRVRSVSTHASQNFNEFDCVDVYGDGAVGMKQTADPKCPWSLPENGAPCDFPEDLTCEYGGEPCCSDFNICYKNSIKCGGGKVRTTPHLCACDDCGTSNGGTSRRRLFQEEVQGKLETAELLYDRGSRFLSEQTSPGWLRDKCGNASYEVTVVYTAGPHFFIGGMPLEDEYKRKGCPLLGFLPNGSVYTADKIEVLEKESDFPGHFVGHTTLKDVMDTYDVVDSLTEENFNLNVDVNTCVHWTLAMIKQMEIDFNEDTLFDFMTKHLLEDSAIHSRYLQALKDSGGRRLRGVVTSLLAGANPATFKGEYKDAIKTEEGSVSIIAMTPKAQRPVVITTMMREYMGEL